MNGLFVCETQQSKRGDRAGPASKTFLEMASFFQRAGHAVKSARRILFGYDAIESSRNRRTRANIGPIQFEEQELQQYDRGRMISLLLDFKRNNPVVAAISRLKRTDVIGAGLIPLPLTISKEYNEKVSELWNEFAENPEVSGLFDMAGVQRELVDAQLFFGDIGLVLTSDGKIQLIEGTRIGSEGMGGGLWSADNSKIGVTTNEVGRPISYGVGNLNSGLLQNVKQIPADNFVLHFSNIRPAQWRGVPGLASCVNVLQDVSEYENLEMLSAKVSATLSAVVTRQNAVQFEIARRDATQDESGRLETFEPGSFHYLDPGESVQTISANGRPNVDAIKWLIHELRKVGAAIGIPYEFILADIGGASFSASQGVNLQYQSGIESDQRLVARTMNKIYKWKLTEWVKAGILTIPATVQNPFLMRWQLPRFRWINRLAQVQSDIRYLQMGAISLDDVASQFGQTAETVLRAKAKNIVLAKTIAAENGLDNYRTLFNQMETYANVNLVEVIEQDKTDSQL